MWTPKYHAIEEKLRYKRRNNPFTNDDANRVSDNMHSLLDAEGKGDSILH